MSPTKVKFRSTPAFDLELRQLRAFVAIVDHGSVTAASKALHLAQSTVSEAISALERILGTELIRHQRGNRAPELTAAGRIFLPRSREVLAAVDRSCAALAQATLNARSSLDIAANESISTYLLPKILTTVRRQWPNTELSVTAATCGDVRQGVKSGLYDLGFMLESADGPNPQRTPETKRPISPTRSGNWEVIAPSVPLVMFADPKHPLLNHGSGHLVARRALKPFSLYISDAAGDFHQLLRRFFDEDRLPGPRLESTGSVEGVKAGVSADPRGLGILPLYVVAEDLKARSVARLELLPALPQMRLVVLTGSRTRHPSANALIEAMRVLCGASAEGKPGRQKQA
ncbi:MAG TPA: LysR family transcriptional regulator [Candidatus Angelobacter sp.]|nr:LysR family transcriptional regulator [Candidatus Angelobacter sp.]